MEHFNISLVVSIVNQAGLILGHNTRKRVPSRRGSININFIIGLNIIRASPREFGTHFSSHMRIASDLHNNNVI